MFYDSESEIENCKNVSFQVNIKESGRGQLFTNISHLLVWEHGDKAGGFDMFVSLLYLIIQ